MNLNLNWKSVQVACLLVGLFTASTNGMDDWPRWRGPGNNDISSESGLLKSWPEGGPKQLWVNNTSGLGYAGIAIVGDHLYTMGLEDDAEFALCLNANDGKEIWRTPIGEKYANGWGDGPRSTPTVDGDFLYCMTANGNLVCLKRANGAEAWSIRMQDFGGSVPQWGYAESPLVDGDKVVCTPGGDEGTMLAVDKLTGKKIWQSEPVTRKLENGELTGPPNAHYSSILPVDWKGKRQYVQLTVLAVIGVDAGNGDVLWQIPFPGRVAVIPSPIFDNGTVYVTAGYGVGSKLIELDGDSNATELWYTKDMQNHHGGVVLVGDCYYGSSAQAFVCQEKQSGSMKWSAREIEKGSVGFADGMLYHVQESNGKVQLIDANPEGFKVKGSFVMEPQTKRRNPKGRIWVHPVIANGKLYLRDQEYILCYDIKQ